MLCQGVWRFITWASWATRLNVQERINNYGRLYISRIGDDGKDIVLQDFVPTTNLGGIRDTTTLNGVVVPVYKLNLTRYVQSIISQEFNNNGLRLYVFPANITSERMVLGGGNHPTHPMKLRLITTKID